ncbi:PRKCA binding protein [Echinococcus multilocularis]|uniref:PRKCA binding protein n=1 Tax=Echinococcus multilocularis TaxID=6211 RepID=A0A0S4MKR8_ECHMU|nr:PRKCA binding protein [Echinococcus multilocularis]
MATYHENCYEVMKGSTIFPLEMDLSRDAFAYKSELINTGEIEDDDDDDDEIDISNDNDVEALADLVSTESNLVNVSLAENVDTLLDFGESAGKTPKPHVEQKDVFDLVDSVAKATLELPQFLTKNRHIR